MSEREEERGDEHQVTPLELFFDLAFVFAITQVTSLLADDPAWGGVLRGMLVLAALWWAWTVYAWLTSAMDVDEGGVRLLIAREAIGQEQKRSVGAVPRARERSVPRAPAARRSLDACVATAVSIAKPSPPRATTTTLASPGPLVAISPGIVRHHRGEIVRLRAEDK